jgi:aminoglycoside phosphotransferase (APT) family kinase protein
MTTTAAGLSLTTDTVPVLAQHRFDEASLERYLLEHIEGFTPPLRVEQTQGGMSNPTFILTDGVGKKYVMRKKPPGKLLPSAHAVDREFRVISALWNTDVPVARPYVLCQDPSVIGVDFYIMSFVEGRVFRNQTLPTQSPAERRAIYFAMADTLAKLHRIDFRAVGLADYGRVGGYLSRQVSRWSQQYEASKTDDIPAMEKLRRWLPEHIPSDEETTIAHGDFRLENIIFHPTEPRVLAVIDWELSTLGAPLSDLAYNCIPYHVSDPTRGDITALDYASYGIPSEEEYVARYRAQIGRGDIPHWTFYLVLSLFRLAAISQGVYKRGLDGNAASPEALLRRDRCRVLANVAWELVEQGVEDH